MARLRTAFRANRVISEYTVNAAPTRQSSRYNATRMPTRSNRLPITRMTSCEKNWESCETSPSMRSISLPGLMSPWNDMSRFRQWEANSERRAFVAVQATFSP